MSYHDLREEFRAYWNIRDSYTSKERKKIRKYFRKKSRELAETGNSQLSNLSQL